MDNESFEQQIAALQAKVSDLAAKNKELRLKFEAQKRNDARYFHLLDEQERLERENAELEGRPYTGDYDDDPDDCSEHPEPPDREG